MLVKRYLILIFILFFLPACSTVDIGRYAGNTPKLDLFDYFQGKTLAWGIVQDRKGILARQFTAEIHGSINSTGELVLVENFNWNDGSTSKRVWTISRLGLDSYRGTAADVVGEAEGIASGNTLNWQYQLIIDYGGSSWEVSLDDWMFLADEKTLINRAKMKKFGVFVGDITIFFQQQAEGENDD